MKRIYYLAAIFFLNSSCQKLLLPNTAPNSPVNNFEEIWQGYSRWYGLFEVKGINWDSLHTVFRSRINNQMSETELYEQLCELIRPLNDPHVFLQPTSHSLPRFESSVFFRENKVQQDFSIDLVREKYIPELVTIDDHFHYGVLDGNIGYVHLGNFGMPVSFYKMQLDKVIQALQHTRAVVVDIRDNGGGSDEAARSIASRFAVAEKTYMTIRKRNGPGRTNFTEPQSWKVIPGAQGYDKPVVLLTTRWTTSAAETFTLAMNTQDHIRQVGDTTAGGLSDVTARELLNGWLYFISVGDYRDAQGASWEGKGIAPAIRIVNTKEDIRQKTDRVLEAAQRLADRETLRARH